MKLVFFKSLILLIVLSLVSCEQNRPTTTTSNSLVLYLVNPDVLTRVPVTPDLIKKWYSAKIELRADLTNRLVLAPQPLPSNLRILVEEVNPEGEVVARHGYAGKEDFGLENWKILQALE